MSSRVERCAAALARCRAAGLRVYEATTRGVNPRNIREAYAVQRHVHSSRSTKERLGNVVGYKVGCTTPVMQDYLSIPHPCAGGMFDKFVWKAPVSSSSTHCHHIDRGAWHRVGLECEIAVILKNRLGGDGQQTTREDAAAAVGSVHAAVELVDDRYEDFQARKPGPLCWIADDFFHAGLVLGPPILMLDGSPIDPMSLNRLYGRLSIDGQTLGEGSGTDIVSGHPLEALRWLANSDVAADRGLPPGWIVSLGSVCRTHWLARDEYNVYVSYTLDEENAGVGQGGPKLDALTSQVSMSFAK